MKHLTTPRRLQRSRGLPAVRRRGGRRRWLAALKAVPLAVALLGAGMSAGAQGYYRAQALPLLPPQGFPHGEGWTIGRAMNDSAMVVGYTQKDTAVRWSFADGLRGIGPSAQAHAIAGDGTAVGWVRILEEGRVVPALWSTTSGLQLVRDLYTGVPDSGMGMAVNNQAWVVALDAASTRSVLLRPGQDALTLGWRDEATETGDGLIGGRINASGMVAGTTWDLKGGYWTEAGGVRSFSVLANGPTYVTGLSDSGLISGWGLVDSAGSPQGYVWDANTNGLRALLPGFQAQDVNNAGVAVGVLGNDAAVWRGGQVVSLNGITADLGPYSLYQAWDVNNSGQILALGRYVGGDPQYTGPAGKTFVLAECLRCGQINPNPNPNSALLDVGPDWFDAHNALDYRNQGTLQIRTAVNNYAGSILRNGGVIDVLGGAGSLYSTGLIDNEPGGSVVVSGQFVTGGEGGLTNRASVRLLEGGTVHLAGSAGVINRSATRFTQAGGHLRNLALFSVEGALLDQQAGTFENGVGGVLRMWGGDAVVAGQFRNGGTLLMAEDPLAPIGEPSRPSQLRVSGTLVNLAGASFTAEDRSVIEVTGGGQIVNQGSFTLAPGATRLTLTTDGSIVNDGGAMQLGSGSRMRIASDGGYLHQNAGTLTIAHGARLEIESTRNLDIYGGRLSNEGVIVARAGAAISNSGNFHLQTGSRLELDGGASFDQGAGELYVASGASIVGAGMLTHIGGTTTVNGMLSLPLSVFTGGVLAGSGVFTGNVVVAGALDIRPGQSPGTLTFQGNLDMDSAVITLEVENHRVFDRIVVGGQLTVGDVMVRLAPGAAFTPDLNDSFAWLSAGSQSGNPLEFDLSALPTGWRGQMNADGSTMGLWNDAAVALAPSPNPAGELLTVGAGSLAFHDAGVAYLNEGTVEVGGALAIRPGASFQQQTGAQLAVLAGGRLSNRGTLSSDGRIDNAGTLVNYEDGQIWASGEGGLANRGRIDNDGLLYVARRLDNEAGGEIVNHGRLETPFGAHVSNRGRIVNHGTVANGGWITNLEGGEFVVAAGATVEAAGPWGLDEYRDLGGITQVDGRLQASRIWLNGATVRGSGTLAGPAQGQARFDLAAGDTLTVDGSLAGWHWFDVALEGSDAFGQLTVGGDFNVGGGLVTFFLVEGGYQPQAGDSFRWLQVGGVAQGLELLNYQILVQADGYQYAWTAPADLRVSFQGDLLVMQPVPEPGSWAMWLAGLGVLGGLARRRLPGRQAETFGH